MRAVLLDHHRLNWDSRIDLAPLRAVADLTIREATSPAELPTAAAGCEVLITKEMPVGADDMARFDRVKLICEAGTGYNNIDVSAAARRGITVCNVPAYSTTAVAQLTMSYLLGIAAGTLGFVARAARGNRSDFDGAPASTMEIDDKVLGVIGPGDIGQQVIKWARDFGMRVLTHSRRPRAWPDAGIQSVGLERLLAESDFVTLHCPLVASGPDATRHLIRASTLQQMKHTAWLVNTSRGGLVNEGDLLAALRSGRIAGAALDVQDPEPPADDCPLWACDNVFLTPHVGWKPIESRRRLIAKVAQNVAAFAAGSPINVVEARD